MAKYPFLSDEWVSEARRIYALSAASGALDAVRPPAPVRVNLVVNQVPWSEASIDAHVDTSSGQVVIDTGHVAQPDVTVSMDYSTARRLFVAGDVQSVMQAFLSGRIKVDGDLSKLLDPRAGIWPAAPGGPFDAARLAGGPSAPAGGAPGGTGTAEEPSSTGRPAPFQPGLGTPTPEAREVAARLQEITE
jgi:hypothetical protein